ncbi:hypothetical protein [Gallaecimonas pentaromativorans]|uniref:Aromatic ring-opening dioxygenase LigA n=1 Tax=Gallaecimonas pentaromativorans TaxID=584787 RepID=A0A3N1PT22_9GAMM|nr:hypothetical protein [Gallaecimonas pentaromativorans]MED5524165.1 hypothetical protein [Pseudomonadota bacterium]ROQ29927.1 hypothetical protein EDC28_102302 [Gallaecimonas pentaromativorans]
MDIKLRFVNHSNDANNSEFVVFQKNVSSDFDELNVAWKVIKNCGQGDYHPFAFPMTMSVGASDSDGNYMPEIVAENGQMYSVQQTTSGHRLQFTGPGTSSKEVQLRNDLTKGAINCNIMKAGRLLATKTGVAPGQKAVFQFKPTIWIGAASQIVEGEVMNSAIISDINTEISLLGIASADLVVTGGGPGANSTPFVFSLENVVMA